MNRVLEDKDLIRLLTKVEDSFVERKPLRQPGEWLKTVVAVANSTPIDYPAVLFIGVDNSGQIADAVDIESTMKSFSDVIESRVWPPVYTLPISLAHQGKTCLAVIIPGSPARPHFAGKSFVRLGTQTKEASEQQFTELVAQWNSKTRELLAWVEKEITVVHRTPVAGANYSEHYPHVKHCVVTCNAHYLTLRSQDPPPEQVFSYPLHWIELGFDHKKDRLRVYIYFDR